MQSKKNSFIEACVSTAVGFIITMLCSLFIYPLCGVHANIGGMSKIAVCFTFVSIARQYIIRRWFNKKQN